MKTWVQSLVWEDPWRREMLPTPIFWPREFHGLYSPRGCKELDTTEWMSFDGKVKREGILESWRLPRGALRSKWQEENTGIYNEKLEPSWEVVKRDMGRKPRNWKRKQRKQFSKPRGPELGPGNRWYSGEYSVQTSLQHTCTSRHKLKNSGCKANFSRPKRMSLNYVLHYSVIHYTVF